jgi:hypothetical protein
MADTAQQMIAPTDPLALLKSILGTKTTYSGSTDVQGKQLTTDQVQAMIQNILGGTDGLASVSNGQRAAGMYNSTVNTQLTNDLLARVSTNVAAAAAPTVTTKSGTTQNVGGVGVGNFILNKLAEKGLNSLSTAAMGNKLLGSGLKTSALDPTSYSLASPASNLGLQANITNTGYDLASSVGGGQGLALPSAVADGTSTLASLGTDILSSSPYAFMLQQAMKPGNLDSLAGTAKTIASAATDITGTAADAPGDVADALGQGLQSLYNTFKSWF